MAENLLRSVILLNELQNGLTGRKVSSTFTLPPDGKINGQLVDVMRFVIEMPDDSQNLAPEKYYDVFADIRASANSGTVFDNGGSKLKPGGLTWYSHPNNAAVPEGNPRWLFGSQWNGGPVSARFGHTFGIQIGVSNGVDAGPIDPFRFRIRIDLINGISEE